MSSSHFVARVSPSLDYGTWLRASKQLRSDSDAQGFEVWTFLDSWEPGLRQLEAIAPLDVIEGLVTEAAPFDQARTDAWTLIVRACLADQAITLVSLEIDRTIDVQRNDAA